MQRREGAGGEGERAEGKKNNILKRETNVTNSLLVKVIPLSVHIKGVIKCNLGN